VPPPAGTVAPAAPPPVIVPAPPALAPAPVLTTTTLAVALPPPSTQSTNDTHASTATQTIAPLVLRDIDPNAAAASELARSAVVQVALQRLDTQPRQETRAGSEAQALAIVTERISDASAALASAQMRTSQVAFVPADNRELFTQVNQIRAELREETKFEAHAMAATAATGVSLSVGFVIWLLRGGALVSTLLSSVPAWRFVDPLPVLGNAADGDGDTDDDSLESLVSGNDDAPASADAPADGEKALT
jgi:hypothetical protein